MQTPPDTTIQEVRERLLQRSEELRADIRRELEKSDDEHYSDLADRLSDEGEQSVADLIVDLDMAEVGRDVRELRDVEAALMRIVQGTYGLCVDCGEPIEPRRLEAMPAATRCLRCQERIEQGGAGEAHPRL